MKILIIGNDIKYQQCYRFRKACDEIEEIEYDFFEVNPENYSNDEKVFKTPHELRIANIKDMKNTYDFILVFQTEICFKISCKWKKKVPIVYWDTEFTWYPSCINADYIFFTHPEREEMFVRYYPQFLKSLKCSLLLPCILPKAKDDVLTRKRKKGIYYMGTLTTQDKRTYYQRTIYNNRLNICSDLACAGILDILISDYENYDEIMKYWEFGLNIDGEGSYFSPRPIEFIREGVIPIIYVGLDLRARQYYEDLGFRDKVNCYFYNGNKNTLYDKKEFYKNHIFNNFMINMEQLFYGRFTLEANLEKIKEVLEIE